MTTPRGTVSTNADTARFFTRCSFRHTNFKKANLAGSILEACDLRNTLWHQTNLMRTTFLGCDLRGVDLADSWRDEFTQFQNCLTDGLTYKSHTKVLGHSMPVGPESKE